MLKGLEQNRLKKMLILNGMASLFCIWGIAVQQIRYIEMKGVPETIAYALG